MTCKNKKCEVCRFIGLILICSFTLLYQMYTKYYINGSNKITSNIFKCKHFIYEIGYVGYIKLATAYLHP